MPAKLHRAYDSQLIVDACDDRCVASQPSMPTLQSSLLGFLAVTLALISGSALVADEPLLYEKDVRPILKANCFHCHGEEEKPHGGLDVRLVRLLSKGGESGSSLTAGKPEKSLLWTRIASDEMPEGPKKLPPAQKAIIRKWIEQGAKTSRPEPTDIAQARFSSEELNHWAFQPVKPITPPTIAPSKSSADNSKGEITSAMLANPIDRFLLAKLRSKNLSFAPIADRRTLIRRLSFDVLGLPPTPEEVDAFVQDKSPDAYEKLVDRLLASPHYGERWARHWFDVAGYSETNGNADGDTDRPNAWRYRDYVIKSLNDDKPYDQFLIEQLAGDELVQHPINKSDPAALEKLTATGFLRLAPDLTERVDTVEERNQAIADVIKTTSSSILGLSLACAQCHDHRYDPISIDDYYRYRALFTPVFSIEHWKKPAQRSVDVTSDKQLSVEAEIEKKAKELEAGIERDVLKLSEAIFARELAKVPEAHRQVLKLAVDKPADKQTPEEKGLLEKFPSVKPISFIKGFIVEYDNKSHREFERRRGEVAKLRQTKPARHQIMTVGAPLEKPPVTKVLFRGDPAQPKQPVMPGELSVLSQHAGSEQAVAPALANVGKGRRLAYARWLTNGKHPLTARVAANRIWLHHFGRGIVNTPADFGLNGERPTHPELLDWLAGEFVKSGWKLKQLHRLMLTSYAYRQESKRRPELEQADVNNELLGRMNIRRLDAESIRDAILVANHTLNRKLYGPSVPVAEDHDGSAVFGRRKLADGLFSGIDNEGVEKTRRSIYIESRRYLPLSMLESFDQPVMAPNCESRRCSTVATQSLFFLNDQLIQRESDQLAERLFKDANTTDARIRRLFAILYAGQPTDAELKRCQVFIDEQKSYFAKHGSKEWMETVKKWPHAPELRSFALLSQILMSANRFLYVD